MPIRKRRGGADGGGGASVGALLRASGETSLGLFISWPGADESWHLRGVERTLEEEATWAAGVYEAGSARLNVTFDSVAATSAKLFIPQLDDGGRGDPPEIVNGYELNHFQYEAPDANPRAAFRDFGDLRVTSRKAAAAGNADWFAATKGRAAVTGFNARANIPGSRGVVRGGDLSFRSPNVAGIAASRVVRITSGSTQQIRITRLAVGEAGNGFRLLFEYDASASGGNPNVSYVSSGSGIDGILVGLRGNTTFTQIINAINAATDNSNNKYVIATGADQTNGGSFSTSASFRYQTTTAYWPIEKQSSGAGGGLEGGSDAGGGARTNIGAVIVERSAERAGGTGQTASASRFLGNLAFRVTFHEAGTAGNGWVITLTGNSGGGTTVDANAKTVAVNINGNLTYLAMKTAIDAIRVGGVQFFTASYNSGLDSQNAGNGSWRLSGGTEVTTNPLSATYDESANELTIVCLPTDTFDDVMDEVATLSQFQRTRAGAAADGTMPGDVFLNAQATTLDTVNPPSNVGDTLSYDFAGGRTAVPAEAVRVIDNTQSSFPLSANTLLIDSYHPDTTVQELIDAYTGTLFNLSSVSGSPNVAIGDQGNQNAIRLSGGRGPVTRQLPDVRLTSVAGGSASYQIFYHGSDTPAGQRTTLAEMKAAWEDVQGGNRPLDPQTVTITGSSGSRISAVPDHPTGGSNYVPSTPIELLARPRDEVHGPNVEIRYHATDTLAEIDEAIASAGHQREAVLVYGTDETGHPEAVGFVRSMFNEGGVTNITGRPGVNVDSEGTRVGVRATVLDFRGSGVTVTGDGNTKRINITGGGSSQNSGDGEENVQADWSEADDTSDAFIKNKPTTLPGPDAAARSAAATADAKAVAAQTTANAALPKSGGTMTGKIVLDGAPTNNLHAATKQYVDGSVPDVPAKASNADVDGESDDADYMTAAKTFRAIARKVKNASNTVQGIVLLARNADVDGSETDTSRIPTVALVKRLVSRIALLKSGGTLTGALTLSGAPTNNLHAASKGYVDAAIPSDGGTVVAANPSGTDGDALTRIAIAGTNYNIGSAAPTRRPSVSSFSAVSGNLNPAPGSLAATVYEVAWAISNSDLVGLARVVGFKGTADPVVLLNIPAGNNAHGDGNAVIPNGISLADGETYTLQLQIFDSGNTNRGATDAPDQLQNLVIRAHAPATAAYHVGYVQYDSGDANAAATAARITGFTNDTDTSPDLPSRMTVALPSDSNEYQIYLMALATDSQPAGFTSGGFPATNSFYPAEDVTIAGTAYSAYILRPDFRLTDDDNGSYFGVLS